MNNSIVYNDYYQNKLLQVCNYYENKNDSVITSNCNSLKSNVDVSIECNIPAIPLNATNFMETIKQSVLIQSPTIKSSQKKRKTLDFETHPSDFSNASTSSDSIIIDTKCLLQFIYDMILNRPCIDCNKMGIFLTVSKNSIFFLLII